MNTTVQTAAEAANVNVTENEKMMSRMDESTLTLRKALDAAFKENGSTRCYKYLLDKKDYPERLSRVMLTLAALRYEKGSVIATRDGESYNLTEYKIPKVLEDYVCSGEVYVNGDAKGYADPVFRSSKVDLEDVYSPAVFNRFFADFNQNQDEGYRLDMNDGIIKKSLFLGDFAYAKDGDEMVKLGDGQGICIETSFLAGVPNFVPKNYLRTYTCPSVDGLKAWLFA